MNAKLAFSSLVVAAAFAGNAFAESPTIDHTVFSSSMSINDVKAELASYRQAGVNPWSTSYNPLRSFRSATTREAVVAEYLAARDEVKALNGEDSGSAYLARMRAPAAPTHLAGQPASAQ